MQDTQWPMPDQRPSYLGVANTTLYRDSPSLTTDPANKSPLQGMSSLSQADTQRRRSLDEHNSSSREGLLHSSVSTRPANFSNMTPFPAQIPHTGGSDGRSRTESVFSFDMGPMFTMKRQLVELYNQDQTNRLQVRVNAKMDRGFFCAEQQWTCYRRNYFQASAAFELHGVDYVLQEPEAPCLLRKGGELCPVEYFSIGISARVCDAKSKPVALVQHTPKRDKGPQMVPKPQAVRPGGNLYLTTIGANQHIVTFERLQFKTATANNGKRRAAQQYYEIVIELYANTNQGEAILVAATHSAPLVVRGRSPGHYADSHTRHASSQSDPLSDRPPLSNALTPPTNNPNNGIGSSHEAPPHFYGARSPAPPGQYPFYSYPIGYQQPPPTTPAVNGSYPPHMIPPPMDQASYFRSQGMSESRPTHPQSPYFGESSGLQPVATGRLDGKTAEWPGQSQVYASSRMYPQHSYNDSST